MAKNRKNKRPATQINPTQEKKPRIQQSNERECFCWRVDHADLHHDEWGWGTLSLGEFFEIAKKLQNIEGIPWNELWNEMGRIHRHSPDRIDSRAQNRLLELSDSGVIPEEWTGLTLHSYRVGSRERVWGYKIGTIYYLLWWDPYHTVYPVELKYT